MRIIGGSLSGRQIVAPSGAGTRPTSDRVREAIFNRLAHGVFQEAAAGAELDHLAVPVLDLYAGAGGLGLEALSRGAPRCDFVDSAQAACAAVKQNLLLLGLSERGRVSRTPAEAFLRRAQPLAVWAQAPAGWAQPPAGSEPRLGYGLVFADPPYADAGASLDRVLALLVERDLLLPGALLIVEHGPDPAPRAVAGGQPGLVPLDERRYGQTVVSFLASAPRGIPVIP